MRWVKHVACMGRVEVYTGFLVGILRDRDHLEDTAVDAGVILGCNIKKCEGWHGLD
jgi:hypothetical protein